MMQRIEVPESSRSGPHHGEELGGTASAQERAEEKAPREDAELRGTPRRSNATPEQPRSPRQAHSPFSPHPRGSPSANGRSSGGLAHKGHGEGRETDDRFPAAGDSLADAAPLREPQVNGDGRAHRSKDAKSSVSPLSEYEEGGELRDAGHWREHETERGRYRESEKEKSRGCEREHVEREGKELGREQREREEREWGREHTEKDERDWGREHRGKERGRERESERGREVERGASERERDERQRSRSTETDQEMEEERGRGREREREGEGANERGKGKGRGRERERGQMRERAHGRDRSQEGGGSSAESDSDEQDEAEKDASGDALYSRMLHIFGEDVLRRFATMGRENLAGPECGEYGTLLPTHPASGAAASRGTGPASVPSAAGPSKASSANGTAAAPAHAHGHRGAAKTGTAPAKAASGSSQDKPHAAPPPAKAEPGKGKLGDGPKVSPLPAGGNAPKKAQPVPLQGQARGVKVESDGGEGEAPTRNQTAPTRPGSDSDELAGSAGAKAVQEKASKAAPLRAAHKGSGARSPLPQAEAALEQLSPGNGKELGQRGGAQAHTQTPEAGAPDLAEAPSQGGESREDDPKEDSELIAAIRMEMVDFPGCMEGVLLPPLPRELFSFLGLDSSSAEAPSANGPSTAAEAGPVDAPRPRGAPAPGRSNAPAAGGLNARANVGVERGAPPRGDGGAKAGAKAVGPVAGAKVKVRLSDPGPGQAELDELGQRMGKGGAEKLRPRSSLDEEGEGDEGLLARERKGQNAMKREKSRSGSGDEAVDAAWGALKRTEPSLGTRAGDDPVQAQAGKKKSKQDTRAGGPSGAALPNGTADLASLPSAARGSAAAEADARRSGARPTWDPDRQKTKGAGAGQGDAGAGPTGKAERAAAPLAASRRADVSTDVSSRGVEHERGRSSERDRDQDADRGGNKDREAPMCSADVAVPRSAPAPVLASAGFLAAASSSSSSSSSSLLRATSPGVTPSLAAIGEAAAHAAPPMAAGAGAGENPALGPERAGALPAAAAPTPQELDNWVLCEKCDTWRLLPPHVPLERFSESFECQMNDWTPDLAYCNVAQETTAAAVYHMMGLPFPAQPLPGGAAPDPGASLSAAPPAGPAPPAGSGGAAGTKGRRGTRDEDEPWAEPGLQRKGSFKGSSKARKTGPGSAGPGSAGPGSAGPASAGRATLPRSRSRKGAAGGKGPVPPLEPTPRESGAAKK